MPETIHLELAAWARTVWPGGDPGPLEREPITPDGSARHFVRLMGGGRHLVAMANPDNPAENRAWRYLARHLARLGLPVAEVWAADLERGRFLMQDLGRASLQEAARARAGDAEALFALYEPVLQMLAWMQAQAAQDLDLGVCFDGPRLDGDFLFRREASYFLGQFVAGACGLAPEAWPPNLTAELAELSRLAGRARPQGFVHRDFQSRNLVWEQGRLGLVDFQGGRLGPAQYDLASLVNDPYVDLPWPLRERLVARYLQLREPLGGLDAAQFLAGWPYVALCRAMQSLGAYAFLCRQRGRGHFAAYAAPALATLRRLAALDELASFPSLGRLLAMLPDPLPPQALAPQAEAVA
ncbi:MAG: aminoglycoside phosphotransferase family protein [Thermodesulfobacteriota bacterium]